MKASAEQKRLMNAFYGHCGWEFMGIDDVCSSDPKGFIDQWKRNIAWLYDVAGETEGFIDDYKALHFVDDEPVTAPAKHYEWDAWRHFWKCEECDHESGIRHAGWCSHDRKDDTSDRQLLRDAE